MVADGVRCQVLLRAVRELVLSPGRGAWAQDLVQNALSTAPGQLSNSEAFVVYQSLMQNLQSVVPLQVRH